MLGYPGWAPADIEKARAYQSNPGSWNIFYETLTYADIKYSNSGERSIGGNSSATGSSTANSSATVTSSSSVKVSSSSANTTNLNGIQNAWYMSVQGESLVLSAISGTHVKVSMTNILGNQRKTLFTGVTNGSVSIAWGTGMPHGRYILGVQVGHENRQVLVSLLGN